MDVNIEANFEVAIVSDKTGEEVNVNTSISCKPNEIRMNAIAKPKVNPKTLLVKASGI